MPLLDRTARMQSPLKPGATSTSSAAPDAAGEAAAFKAIAGFAQACGRDVHVIVDPAEGSTVRVPAAAAGEGGGGGGGGADAAAAASAPSSTAGVVYAYVDAVDGTLLLSGLGCGDTANGEPGAAAASVSSPPPPPPPPPPRLLRLAGAGPWAVGVAFTDPTSKLPAQLTVGDFTVAAVGDGATCACVQPSVGAQAVAGSSSGSSNGGSGQLLHPSLAVAVWEEEEAGCGGTGGGSGSYATYDLSGHKCWPGSSSGGGDGDKTLNAAASPLPPRLHATTCRYLCQTFAALDAFQARDAKTAAPGDAALADALHSALSDRHDGGAFDVLRSYGNLGSLLRGFFGWRGSATWLEPQLGAFVAVNENLANLVPAVPLVLGAGGVAADLLTGAPLVELPLRRGRVTVAYAANEALFAAVIKAASRARASSRAS
jgi:hypothetical protein